MTKGRKPKYLTIEKFEQFLCNDFAHVKRLLYIILAGLIVAALIDRLV